LKGAVWRHAALKDFHFHFQSYCHLLATGKKKGKWICLPSTHSHQIFKRRRLLPKMQKYLQSLRNWVKGEIEHTLWLQGVASTAATIFYANAFWSTRHICKNCQPQLKMLLLPPHSILSIPLLRLTLFMPIFNDFLVWLSLVLIYFRSSNKILRFLQSEPF